MKAQIGSRSASAGISLLEILICVAILMLTAAIALPHTTQMLTQQRIRQQMLLLHAQLAMARSTAITRSTPVSLCPSRDGVLCRTDSDWSSGRRMYLDGGRRAQPGSPADVLLVTPQEPLPTGATIRTGTSRKRIRFQADGRSAGSNTTFYFCHAGQLQGKVVINNLGRTRSERPRQPEPCT